MWKTRNIRRRNKKRKTKKQDGGLLSFMGPDMAKIIDFAANNDIEVTAQIEKKTGMFSKATMSDPFKVKFIEGKQINFIQAEETKLEQIDPNIKPDTSYKYEMKGSNVEVILNLKTRIILIIDKTSIADINDKMKMKWDAILPPKPSEIEIKLKMETNQKGRDLLELLQKIQLLLERPVQETPIVEKTQSEVIQTGGADNSLLDEIITKYPSLKGLKSMIDDLPEDIRQKYESEINTTLEKVKESNVPEPEFQEIQADLNTQFPINTNNETSIEEEKPDVTPIEEEKTDVTPIEEEKTDVTPTDEEKTDGEPIEEEKTDVTPIEEEKTDVETPTEEEKTDVMPPTVPTDTTPTVPTDTTTTTPTVPTDTTTTTPTVPTDTTVPTTTDTATTPSDEVKLKREDLKESPLLVQPTTGESGKYIFVPKDLVEKAIDFLLNNGCEVTTVNLK